MNVNVELTARTAVSTMAPLSGRAGRLENA